MTQRTEPARPREPRTVTISARLINATLPLVEKQAWLIAANGTFVLYKQENDEGYEDLVLFRVTDAGLSAPEYGVWLDLEAIAAETEVRG